MSKKKKQRFVNSLFIEETVYNVEDRVQSSMYSVEVILNAALQTFNISNEFAKKEIAKMLIEPEILEEYTVKEGSESAEVLEKQIDELIEIRIKGFKTGINNHFINVMKFLKMVDIDDKKHKPKSNIQSITPKIII